MDKPLAYSTISSTKEYDDLLNRLYVKVKTEPIEITVPTVNIIAVNGNEPPASKQYAQAISALYGIGYTLKMGLKHGKLPQPERYFDYKVGGLETLWWNKNGGEVEIDNPKTLRWQAYLMVPHFIDNDLIKQAGDQAGQKHPEIPYGNVSLRELDEGHSVQCLHIGPYNQESPTIEKIMKYINENGLKVSGKHHEIYISDPRRTKPERLKTVIRHPVKQI